MDIKAICKEAQRIGISGHIRPDGDCVGSCLGLYLYLKKIYPEKQVTVYLEQPSEIFRCIKGFDAIHILKNDEPLEEKPHDLFFALDCSKDRLGMAGALFEQAKVTVNLDHHITNSGKEADYNEVDPAASSCSEVIFGCMDDTKLDEDIAKAIYIGIIHDTGVFQYSNTRPLTFQIAAKLIGFGFDFPKLIEETFYEKTYVQNQIMGRALLESMLFMDGTCVVSHLDKKTMEFYQVTGADLDGIVSQLRNTKGVECAIFMYELETLTYKVSMRSGGMVNVAEIAGFFGGGGHVRAAGCTMNGTFHDVVNNLSGHIEKQLLEKGVLK